MPKKLNPKSLSLSDLKELLQVSGSQAVTDDLLQRVLGMGAISNSDGTYNLIHVVASIARDVN